MMSEMARELVQQALDQDYNKANKTFGELISAKLSDVLDQEKIKVASSIYNGIDPDEEDDQYEGEEENIEDEEDNSIESDLSAEDDDEMEEDSEEAEDEDILLDDEEE